MISVKFWCSDNTVLFCRCKADNVRNTCYRVAERNHKRLSDPFMYAIIKTEKKAALKNKVESHSEPQPKQEWEQLEFKF